MQVPTSDGRTQDIAMSAEESKRLEECFKDRKFRDLLCDYVKEISNPKTKHAYEEYLRQVENEGGQPQNRQLMKPDPRFCIKAKTIPPIDRNSTSSKEHKKHIYINCCAGKLVKDALLANSSGYDHKLNSSGSKKAGLHWQIPYILGPKRFDSNDGSIMYDIAFSEGTLRLYEQQQSFKNIVIQTAMEAVNNIENDYDLYVDFKTNKKYKLLKTKKYKSSVEPPLMSVIVTDDKPKRLIDTKKVSNLLKGEKSKISSSKKKQSNLEEMKYKIIESAASSAGDMRHFWSDNNLLIEPLKRPKQIYVVIKLKNVQSIKDIDVQMNVNKEKKRYKVSVDVKNGKYKKCEIDLANYDILSSSMNASWYKQKNELKLTFDIAPLTKTQIDKIRAKYAKIKEHKEQKKEAMNVDTESVNDGGFVIKEVSTKCIKSNKAKDDDHKEVEVGKKEIVPLCHHKLPMKEVMIRGRACWVCSKSQNEKCTAFKWKNKEKKIKKDFEIEQRKKFDKIVLLVRVTNIMQKSVDIKFEQNGQIVIEFETEQFKYHKIVKLEDYCIDVKQSRFDVNCRNLLIMAIKQKESESKDENAFDDILNDSVLFEID